MPQKGLKKASTKISRKKDKKRQVFREKGWVQQQKAPAAKTRNHVKGSWVF